jgi:HK97 family phage portal protein
VNPIQRVLTGLGVRSLTDDDGSWEGLLGGSATASGQRVSVRGSIALVPIYSAVSLIASSAGSLPLVVYRRLQDGGRERASNHRAWSMLHDAPNDEMAADELWEMIYWHLLLWGNAVLFKIRGRFDLVEGLWPLAPHRVQVKRGPNGERQFVVDGKDTYTESEILHIRGPSLDGLVGLSPIQECRETLGVMQAQGQFLGRFLNGDGKPGVILEHPNRVSPEAAERLERSFDAAKAGSTKLLEEGMKATKWTMPLADAQFIEGMQFSDLRVAQMFNLPPGKLGAKSGDSLTYSTTELDGINLVTYTLRRWLIRVEKSIQRDPSIFVQGQRFFAEFLTDALMRGDTKSRYEAYAIGLDKGFLLKEEVRDRENLPRFEEGQEPDAPAEPPPPA